LHDRGIGPLPVKAQTMTDADMDKMTAGEGIGNAWAYGKEGTPAWQFNGGLGVSKNH